MRRRSTQRRSIAWLGMSVLFTLGNIAGAVYAGTMGEMRHAGLHVVLAILGAYFIQLTAVRRRPMTAEVAGGAVMDGAPHELSSRLNSLEQSLDAIAVEVERVGEGQRFMTRLFTERRERKPDGE